MVWLKRLIFSFSLLFSSSNLFSNELNVNVVTELSCILKIKTKKIDKRGVLKNKSFLFSGKHAGISRAEAKSLIEKNSGITLSSVSSNLDFLVIGDKPTTRKIQQARSLGVKIISLAELKKLLN